jgi:hypothetical protein
VLIWLLLLIGVGAAVSKGVSSYITGQQVKKELGGVYEEQKTRLEHQYETQKERIGEKAVEVRGQQQAALAAMGQAGGEGTAGAGILAQTEARKTADLGLLSTTYQDALKDLKAQHDLAVAEQNKATSFDIESALLNIASIGTQFLGSGIGIGGSRSTLGEWLKPQTYDWGLTIG